MQHASIVLAITAALVAAPGLSYGESRVVAHADMVDLQGKAVGRANFEQTQHGVLITVEVTGLPPGWHGIHIHETAACEPPFASAGGHFNPSGERHGYRTEGLHAGDLPNIFVGPDGKATAAMINDRVALRTDRPTDVNLLNRAIGAVRDTAGIQAYNLLHGRGTALVVHSRADDYNSEPSGESGDRIACGVIRG